MLRTWLIAATAATTLLQVQLLPRIVERSVIGCWDAPESQSCGDKPCYHFHFCCHHLWGSRGLSHCFDGGYYTFERCCFFHPGNGNEKSLPALQMDELNIVTGFLRQSGNTTAHGANQNSWPVRYPRVLRLQQNLSEAKWDDQIPSLLFKQAYAMLRWFESLPDDTFIGRSVLELGAGIGLLSIHAALRGAIVTVTDGSTRSLSIARHNAQANVPQHVFWNRLTWRLVKWEDAQSEGAVRQVGLSPPYALVVCSALLYAPTPRVVELVRMLWACTDESSQILWGSGQVSASLASERWALLSQCFDIIEEVDAVAAAYTSVEGTTVVRLQRRRSKLPRTTHDSLLHTGEESLPC